MCDYSLERVSSRPARAGDELVTSIFSDSFTQGFAAVGAPDVAVCLMPGTEIEFENEPKRRRAAFFGWFFFRSELNGKVARFRQVNLDSPLAHHDALEFADGTIVLLTQLQVGQRATVLQLPASLHLVGKNGAQKRALRVR